MERPSRSDQTRAEQAFLSLVVRRRERPAETKRKMQKSDVTCPKCDAGYRRVQLFYQQGTTGEFRCRLCDHVLEVFDGSKYVAFRLTVQSERASNGGRPQLADSI
jgi:transposase-like protein